MESGIDRRGVLKAAFLGAAAIATGGIGSATAFADTASLKWRPIGLPGIRHLAARVEARIRPGDYVGVGTDEARRQQLVIWRGLDVRSHPLGDHKGSIRKVWANGHGDVVGELTVSESDTSAFALPAGSSSPVRLATPEDTRTTQIGGITEDGYIPAVLNNGAAMGYWLVDEPERFIRLASHVDDLQSVVGVLPDHTWIVNRSRGTAATWRYNSFVKNLPYERVVAVCGDWMSVVDVYGGTRTSCKLVGGPAFDMVGVHSISATGLVVGSDKETFQAAVYRDKPDQTQEIVPGRSPNDRVQLTSVTPDDELLGCVNGADPMVWRYEQR